MDVIEVKKKAHIQSRSVKRNPSSEIIMCFLVRFRCNINASTKNFSKQFLNRLSCMSVNMFQALCIIKFSFVIHFRSNITLDSVRLIRFSKELRNRIDHINTREARLPVIKQSIQTHLSRRCDIRVI